MSHWLWALCGFIIGAAVTFGTILFIGAHIGSRLLDAAQSVSPRSGDWTL